MALYTGNFNESNEKNSTTQLNELIANSGINFARYRRWSKLGAIIFLSAIGLGLVGVGVTFLAYSAFTMPLLTAFAYPLSVAGLMGLIGGSMWWGAGRTDRLCQRLVKHFEWYANRQKVVRRWSFMKPWLQRTFVKNTQMSSRQRDKNTKKVVRLSAKCIKKGILQEDQFEKLFNPDEDMQKIVKDSSAPDTMERTQKSSKNNRVIKDYVKIAQSYKNFVGDINTNCLASNVDIQKSPAQKTNITVVGINGDKIIELQGETEAEGCVNQLKVFDSAKKLDKSCFPLDLVVKSENDEGKMISSTVTMLDNVQAENTFEELSKKYKDVLDSATTPVSITNEPAQIIH